MSKKDILFLINTFSVGGAENHLLMLITNLSRKANYNITVGFFEEADRSAESLVPAFLKLEGVSLVKIGCLRNTRIPDFIALFSLINKINPQIVHTFLFKADLFGILISRILGVPKVLSTVNDHELFAHHRNKYIFSLCEFIMNHVYSLADHVIVISLAIKRTVRTKFPKISDDKIHLIYYGIENIGFGSAGSYLRRKAGIPEQKKIICCIGRIDSNKRQDLLVDAFSIIDNSGLALVFVGHDDYGLWARLSEKIAQRFITNNTYYIGFDPNIKKILSEIDILVCCSENEGLGLIVIEALFAGALTIVSDSGAYPELIEDSVTGYHFSSGNHISLAAVIEKALADNSSKTIRSNAVRFAENNFSITKMMESIEFLYNK